MAVRLGVAEGVAGSGRALGVLVMQASFVARGSKEVSPCAGSCWSATGYPSSCSTSTTPEIVQNFTLMHEVVHGLLNARGVASAENESICNRLAAAVLMPRAVFTAEAAPLFRRLELLDAAKTVGRRLHVSPTSALIRAADLDLVDRALADAIIRTLLIGRRKGGGSGPVENSEGRKGHQPPGHEGRAPPRGRGRARQVERCLTATARLLLRHERDRGSVPAFLPDVMGGGNRTRVSTPPAISRP